jgi:hypothetical protein
VEEVLWYGRVAGMEMQARGREIDDQGRGRVAEGRGVVEATCCQLKRRKGENIT